MNDDLTQKRKERMEKLELAQALYNILLRNAYREVDSMFATVIERGFTGKLELLIKRPDSRALRRDLHISMRLLRADEAERPDSFCIQVDPPTVNDIFQRMREPSEPSDGPVHDVMVVDHDRLEPEPASCTCFRAKSFRERECSVHPR